MPHVNEYAPGTPSWVDLGTTDLNGATRFYGQLFGWSVVESSTQAGGYRMCVYDDRVVAGIAPQPEGMSSWWTTYISVADVEQSADDVVANGGSLLVAPMDVLDAGRLAVVTDPGGASFSLWQPGRLIGAGIVNDANTFCWNELFSREPVRSIEFYSAVFGWRPHHHGDRDGDYVEFHLGDQSVAGMVPMVGEMWPARFSNHWMVSFAVDDVDESAARASALGGTVAVPPSENLSGRFAFLIDPQGAVFSIVTFRVEAA